MVSGVMIRSPFTKLATLKSRKIVLFSHICNVTNIAYVTKFGDVTEPSKTMFCMFDMYRK